MAEGLNLVEAVDRRGPFAVWDLMTEDEQRSFIADKLGDKVPEEKLTEIQDAVVTAVAQKGQATAPTVG